MANAPLHARRAPLAAKVVPASACCPTRLRARQAGGLAREGRAQHFAHACVLYARQPASFKHSFEPSGLCQAGGPAGPSTISTPAGAPSQPVPRAASSGVAGRCMRAACSNSIPETAQPWACVAAPRGAGGNAGPKQNPTLPQTQTHEGARRGHHAAVMPSQSSCHQGRSVPSVDPLRRAFDERCHVRTTPPLPGDRAAPRPANCLRAHTTSYLIRRVTARSQRTAIDPQTVARCAQRDGSWRR